jgi:hypothetical protein
LAEPVSCVAAAGNGDLNLFDATRAHDLIGNLLQGLKRFSSRRLGPFGVNETHSIKRTPFPCFQIVLVRQRAFSRVEMRECINGTNLFSAGPDNAFMTRQLLVLHGYGILH